MTGVVWWWNSGTDKRGYQNQNCGTAVTATRVFTGMWWNILQKSSALLLLTFTVLILCSEVSGHRQQPLSRRPTSSLGLEAYRNRWMAYLNTLGTTSKPRIRPAASVAAPVRVRVGNQDNSVVIKGFKCERTYAFFSNKNNPRMYHLCARTRDNWYVYHYHCPLGTVFQDDRKQCMQERGETGGNEEDDGVIVLRKPDIHKIPARRKTTLAPLRVSRKTTAKTRRATRRTTTTTTEAPTTSTTTEEPEAVPEPDLDHFDVTENTFASSEEEGQSTEDDKAAIDVVVSLPGFFMNTSTEQQLLSDEISEEEIEESEPSQEYDLSNEKVNMIIPSKSANEPSRLVGTTATPSPTFGSTKKQKQSMPMALPMKRIPLKAMKPSPVSANDVVDESSNGSTAGRRPRIMKEINWRDLLF